MAIPWTLVCLRCGERMAAGGAVPGEGPEVGSPNAVRSFPWTGCPRCAGEGVSANLVFAYEGTGEGGRSDGPGVWRWGAPLPVPADPAVSLGEGGTPLIPSRLEENCWLKFEGANPTGSFKDRFAAVAAAAAKRFGAAATVAASTGNHGLAAAAYSARAGLPCLVFVGAGTAPGIVASLQAVGATVVRVTTREGRWDLLRQCVEAWGWYPMTTFTRPPVGNPFGVEGYKTIAYELAPAEPDWVLFPAGHGDGLFGTWRGFGEVYRAGKLSRLPRMVAVEVIGSMAAAYERGRDVPAPVPMRDTVAGVIGTDWAGFQGYTAVRDSGGRAVALTDEEVLAAQRDLARHEGLLVEPAAAAGFAALRRARAEGWIGRGERVVCVLTATGMREFPPSSSPGEAPLMEPVWEHFRAWLARRPDWAPLVERSAPG